MAFVATLLPLPALPCTRWTTFPHRTPHLHMPAHSAFTTGRCTPSVQFHVRFACGILPALLHALPGAGICVLGQHCCLPTLPPFPRHPVTTPVERLRGAARTHLLPACTAGRGDSFPLLLAILLPPTHPKHHRVRTADAVVHTPTPLPAALPPFYYHLHWFTPYPTQ